MIVNDGGWDRLSWFKPDTEWHLIVATFSPLGIQLYVDDVLAYNTHSVVNEQGAGFLRVGHTPADDKMRYSTLKGEVAMVAVYDRALSRAEIQGVWTHLSPRFPVAPQ